MILNIVELNKWVLIAFEELDSTNNKAKELTENSSYERFVVTTKKQTKGKGRRGNSWIGIEGNLFASFALKLDIKEFGKLPFILSLSVLDVIKDLNPLADIKLKWPNDVLANDKKISGILIEKGEGDFFIMGVGVNIVGSPNDINEKYETEFVNNINIQSTSDSFLNAYINKLNYYLYNINNFSSIKDKWLGYAKRLNEEILVSLENTEIKGIFRGIDDNGALLLEVDGNIKKIYAGEVFYS